MAVLGAPVCLAQGADPVVEAVVHDVCHKRVALLGEPPMHGLARTLELKVAIVRRLVDECGYTGVVFESGTYDFLNLERRRTHGQPIDGPMIQAAIGGLWANAEVAPLVAFLLPRVRTGAVVLGGMDDQLGRGTYAQLAMPADLVRHLPADRREGCLAILNRHMRYEYTNDAPYGAAARARIVACLDTLSAVGTRAADAPDEYDSQMIESLRRTFRRDALQESASGVIAGFNDRDQSMFANLQWWMRRGPAVRKFIVWTATIHAAKNLGGVPGVEQFRPLGGYVNHEFGSSAFAVAFSPLTGSYAMTGQAAHQLSAPPDTSLEAEALAGSDAEASYVGAARLATLQAIAARPLGTDFKKARWDVVFDGVVVVRNEHPPTRLPNPGS